MGTARNVTHELRNNWGDCQKRNRTVTVPNRNDLSLRVMDNPNAKHIACSTEAHSSPMAPYAATLGANVERLRKEEKITKTRFAEMLGIGRPLLNKVEAGKADPRLSLICKMASALEVSPGELLSLPAEPKPVPMRLTPRGHLIPDDGYRLPK